MCLVGLGMYAGVVPNHFYLSRVSQKIVFDQFCLIICYILKNRVHPFSLMYKIFLKMCLVYTSSWVHFSTKFNGVFFFGLIMDVRLRRCWKNIKKVLKRVSKIACFLGPNYGRLKTGRKTTTFYLPHSFGCRRFLPSF